MYDTIQSYLSWRVAKCAKPNDYESHDYSQHISFQHFMGIGKYKRPRLPNCFQSVGVYEIGVNVNLKLSVLVYAPPCSGKSSYVAQQLPCREWWDTDYLHYWTSEYADYCMTNMANLITKADTSIAIVPSEPTFNSRCLGRGLSVGCTWFSDMIRDAQNATIVVHTDKYVSEVMNSHPAILAILPTE